MTQQFTLKWISHTETWLSEDTVKVTKYCATFPMSRNKDSKGLSTNAVDCTWSPNTYPPLSYPLSTQYCLTFSMVRRQIRGELYAHTDNSMGPKNKVRCLKCDVITAPRLSPAVDGWEAGRNYDVTFETSDFVLRTHRHINRNEVKVSFMDLWTSFLNAFYFFIFPLGRASRFTKKYFCIARWWIWPLLVYRSQTEP